MKADRKKKFNKLIVEANDVSDVSSSSDYELNFATYNGPAMLGHASKRLMIGYVSHHGKSKDIEKADKEKKSLVIQEFKNSFVLLMENEFQLLRNSSTLVTTDLIKNLTNETKYFLTVKLGFIYFYGKYLNWNCSYTVNNIRKIIEGYPVENIQKDAIMKYYFNSNKSIENIERFERNIYNRGYRLFKQTHHYYLKLMNKQTKEVIIVNLDENFKIIDILQEAERLCDIDILRNRLRSLYTIAGTFLDIFDLRYQLTKTKEIKKENYKNVLFSNNEPPRCFNISDLKLKECLENILLRMPDGNLLLNPHILHKPTYLKEVKSKIYKLPSIKNFNFYNLTTNFNIHVENIIEYKIFSNQKKNNSERIFNKTLIADSIVECKFDVDNWLLDSFELNSDPKSNIKIEDMIAEVTDYLFQETFSLSDKAHQCVNSLSRSEYEQASTTEFSLPRVKTANTIKIEQVNYTKNLPTKKLTNQEKMAVIKRILFSRTHLDIFGLSINTNFFDGVSDRDIKREYNKMMNFFLENEKVEKYNVKTSEDLALIPFNGTGMFRTAYKKLNEAYFTLKDPLKRDIYINQLSKNKKY